MTNEQIFIVCVALIAVWYYFYVHKQGKTLSSLMSTPAPTTPASTNTPTTAPAPEGFANDVKKYKKTADPFSHDSLMAKLH